MVKVRGYRVELGEVEASSTGTRPSGRRWYCRCRMSCCSRLRAVVTADGAANLTRENVLDHCRQWLPGYMVPDIVEVRGRCREPRPARSTGRPRPGAARVEPAGDGRREKR